MIICPLEGTLIFSKCPVHTCMWYKGAGTCSHGEPRDQRDADEDLGEEVNEVKVRILQYVTVGSFLEAKVEKELASFTDSDFPQRPEFHTWCKQHNVKSHKDIPYNDIVTHIRNAL